MLIDLDHIHFWIDAIRKSSNPHRTMDAFWSGQLKSKIWLIEALQKCINTHNLKCDTIDIHGGWVGVLASLIFQSKIPVKYIRSIDIDDESTKIASIMNKKEEMDNKFLSITSDMCDFKSNTDIIINTSCEHISQTQYNKWLLDSCDKKSLLVLQSNNYNIEEHVRTADSLSQFAEQCNLKTILFQDSLQLPLYTRWMIIGKNV